MQNFYLRSSISEQKVGEVPVSLGERVTRVK